MDVSFKFKFQLSNFIYSVTNLTNPFNPDLLPTLDAIANATVKECTPTSRQTNETSDTTTTAAPSTNETTTSASTETTTAAPTVQGEGEAFDQYYKDMNNTMAAIEDGIGITNATIPSDNSTTTASPTTDSTATGSSSTAAGSTSSTTFSSTAFSTSTSSSSTSSSASGSGSGVGRRMRRKYQFYN